MGDLTPAAMKVVQWFEANNRKPWGQYLQVRLNTNPRKDGKGRWHLSLSRTGYDAVRGAMVEGAVHHHTFGTGDDLSALLVETFNRFQSEVKAAERSSKRPVKSGPPPNSNGSSHTAPPRSIKRRVVTSAPSSSKTTPSTGSSKTRIVRRRG